MWKDTVTNFERRQRLARRLLFVLIVIALMLGAYAFGRSQSPAGVASEDRESAALYLQALELVQENYVDRGEVNVDEQTYGAIIGMLESLGDEGHTRFLTPGQVEENREGLSGEYIGIGVQLEDRDDAVVVAAPIDGSPADEAGMEAGDVIVAVDGEDVQEEELERVIERVRGPEGTEVRIAVERDDREQEFTLERSEITVPAASWAVIPGTDVAHLRLASFSNNSAEELRRAIEEARAAGAGRFVLDLRDNPGGRVDQAEQIAATFLPPESVIYIRRDASGEREEKRVPDDAEPYDFPLVVLVNEGSASSGEIIAGALRDNGRATMIGERTFGTGTVLAEYGLRDGSSILLGVAEWLTPNGDFIREKGILPEVEVALEEGQEPLLPSDIEDGLGESEIRARDAQLSQALDELSV